MARVKYMGVAHRRRMKKGESFNGSLATPLPRDLQWGKENNFIEDLVDLSDEAVAMVLAQPDFLDVSEMTSIPPNRHQRLFLGMSTPQLTRGFVSEDHKREMEAKASETPEEKPAETAEAEVEAAVSESPSDVEDAPTPITGGSTAGSGRRGGRGGTAPGGSARG